MRSIDSVLNPSSRLPTRSSARRSRLVNRMLLRLEQLEDRSTPAILSVNSLLDNQIPGDGLVTLREAIVAHNNNGSTDLGQVATGVDTILLGSLSGTIFLTQGELQISYFTTGGFTISLDIVGPGADLLTISGNNSSRVFNNADANGTLILRDVTVANGIAADAAGGAGILNDGTLFLERSVVRDHTYVGTAATFGAGIHNRGAANLTLSQTLVANNTGGASGILLGGGVASFGNLNVQNSTFFNNSADDIGGAIYIGSGVAMLTNNTIVGNRSDNDNIGNGPGGGIAVQSPSTVVLRNNIIAGNTRSGGAPSDLFGQFDPSSANNIIGLDSGAAGITNGTNGNILGQSVPLDPLISPLGNYGGPTPTFALLPGSLALDAGGDFGLIFDQRGLARSGVADIGAFESGGFTLTATSGTPQAVVIERQFADSLQVQVVANNSIEPVAGGRVVFVPVPADNGASAFLNFPAPIDSNGMTSIVAAANFFAGSYSVLASAAPTNPSATFQLTNLGIGTQLFLTNGTTNPTTFGEGVFFLARALATDGSAVSGGQIDLFSEGNYVGSVFPDMPFPVEIIDPSFLTVGDHLFTAVYISPNENMIPGSESSFLLTILRAPTQTSIVVDPTATNVGDPVRISGTVEVLNGSTSAMGTATLIVDGVEVATVPLVVDSRSEVPSTIYEFVTDGLPPGPHTVTVRYDGDGVTAPSLSESLVATVNGPPAVLPGDNQLAFEGIERLFDLGDFADPGSPGPFTVIVDWGDDTEQTVFSVSQFGSLGSQPHTYADNGIFTVTVVVSDGTFMSEPRTFTVAVANVAPRFFDPIRPEFILTDTLDFTLDALTLIDPGLLDSLRVVIDWGDGSEPTVIDLEPGEREIPPEELAHRFPSIDRTYRVTATVTDKDGDSTEQVSFVNVALPDEPEVPVDEDDPPLDITILDFDLGEDFFDEDANDFFAQDDFFPDFTEGGELQQTSEEFRDENLDEETPAIEFRGAELIRLDLPRFGPPMSPPRPEMRSEVTQPPAPVPVATRVGETPPPSSPLNEKSPLGTPINLFNSVFDSDDSVNLIDSLRRDLSKPKPSMVTPTSTNGTGTNGPMSFLLPTPEAETRATRPSWMLNLALVAFGGMWWNRSRRVRGKRPR